MKRRDFEIDQASRKLRAALRDLASVCEHLAKARTAARTIKEIEQVEPGLKACAERLEQLTRGK